jgi:glycerol-3-phosphate acyltransferase PlsY
MSSAFGWWLLASYLLGAIPTSWITVRLVKGQDLRRLGSGNLGATNLYRQLGWKFAVPVGLFDLAKGALPVMAFGPMAGGGLLAAALLGVVAVIGHVFSVFVGFKGGKGVATGAGVVLGLAPWAFIVALIVWIVTVWRSGYVSLGSVLGAAVLPAAVWVLYPGRRDLIGLFILLAAAIIVLHRSNLQRLRAGTEHRFGRSREPSGGTSP